MEKDMSYALDKSHYTRLMAQKLPVLRMALGLNQTELANVIGVTRQTLSAAESGARELSWGNFISLLFVFTRNEQTRILLEAFNIYTKELDSLFRIADLDALRGPHDIKAPEDR